jgi:hypothetical protein
MQSQSILAGLTIAIIAAVLAEVWWRVLRPKTAAQMTVCWMGGILTRIAVALAGLAICLGLFHLAAPPLVLAMTAGYAIALAVETRITLRRLGRTS